MPIIPRYQPRGGPRVGGLDYAGAYSPPDGSDWRTLAKAAALASDVSGAFNKGQAPAGDRAEAARAGLSEIDRVRAEIEALNWRKGQLDADGEAVDAEQAELSRQAAGEGLSSGVRAAFDALTAARVEGYSALADSRRDDQRSRAARSISQARQALGVEEFLKLADVAPSQARAALGSAAAAAGELARASGADEAGVAEARRATLVAAQVRRIGETIGRDPARAAKILEEEGGVLPDAQRARLSREVELEQARVDANQAAAQMAGEHPDLVDDLDGFLAGMEATAGEGAHRIEAFRAAGMGAWRAARAAREAMESQAWAAVSPLLNPESGVHSWTQLPADLWRSLSERQQRAVQARLDAPWAESDGPTLAAVRSLAAHDPESFLDLDLVPFLEQLTLGDYDKFSKLQRQARAGVSQWKGQHEALESEEDPSTPKPELQDAKNTNSLLHRASYAQPLSQYQRPLSILPPRGQLQQPSPLSTQTREFNLSIGWIEIDDGWHVDDRTGHFYRRGRGMNPQTGRFEFGVVYATPEEAQRATERRLGVDEHPPGVRSRKERNLRLSDFGEYSDRSGLPWPALKVPNDVDWDFLAMKESGSVDTKLELYVPYPPEGGKDISGPTIAHGADIGQKSVAELRTMGFGPDVLALLIPYADMRGETARQFVRARPLVVTQDQADEIDSRFREFEMGRLTKAYDRDSSMGRFRSLPPRTQTAIASYYYNFGTSNPRKRKPWQGLMSGDWEAAASAIESSGGDPERRRQEAALIRRDIAEGLLVDSVPLSLMKRPRKRP